MCSTLEPYAIVECLERVVLNEGDAVYHDVVDLGPELDPLVFLSPDYRTQVRSVDAYDSMLDPLSLEKTSLLVKDHPACLGPFGLFGSQNGQTACDLVEPAPFFQEPFKKVQKPASQLPGLRLARLPLFGIDKSGLAHVMISRAGYGFAPETAFVPEKTVQPFAAFPQKLDVGRIVQQALITCGVGQHHILVFQLSFPFVIEYLL